MNQLKPILALLCATLTVSGALAATPVNLRCEYLTNPLGLDTAAPRLSWEMNSDARGARQTAYQVLVSSSAESLVADRADLWDSGTVASEQCNQLAYAGAALKSGQPCWWKVRLWDENGKPSGWSDTALWTMGLLSPRDWRAQWIGYDRAYEKDADNDLLLSTTGLRWVRAPESAAKGVKSIALRRVLTLPDRPLRRAVFVCYADNQAELFVNGKPAGAALRWEQVARLDITASLSAGDNVLALAVTNSDTKTAREFLPPAVIGKCVIQFADGEWLEVPVNAGWKTAASPSAGWERGGFDDQAWVAAEPCNVPWSGLQNIRRLPAPYLRRDFQVPGRVKRATVYATALGVYELRLNGEKVGADVLTPGWPEFRKRVFYQTYDVTRQLRGGGNTIGAALGDGWYAGTLGLSGRRNYYGGTPRLLAQLVVELEDGNTLTVATDENWRASYGPIRHADLLLGAEYDARLELRGWDSPGFDQSRWEAVAVGDNTVPPLDVTARLSAAVRDNSLTLKVGNGTMGGDPAHGLPKNLRVTWRDGDGEEQTLTVAENQTLTLGAKNLRIVSASYGAQKAGWPPPPAQANVAEPARRIEELAALSVSETAPGVYTFDLGQNMAGWARLKVSGSAGQRVTVRHGEMLNPDGTVYTANLRGATAADFYILSGSGTETFEPPFTFHGFRYVEVRGLSQAPAADAVTGVVVHSDMRRAGSFECSNPLLNQLQRNIVWGQKGNYLEVPTDCPQRDERLGWTGDAQVFLPTAAFNFDVAPFFSRFLVTLDQDSQRDDGAFANVAPSMLRAGATAWGDAGIICPHRIWRVYGDTRVIASHWDAMERHMGYFAGKTKDGIAHVGGYGDWLNKGGGAKGEVIDTAYYAHLAGLMAEMASAIGRADDAKKYAALRDTEAAAFARFFNADGSIQDSSQTGYALAFTMGLVPDALREAAARKYVAEIERFGNHLATGFIGTPRLLPGLRAAGRNDVACQLLLQDTCPSWLFPVRLGATTMWERWDSWTPERGFEDVSMNSFNHYAFGAVGEYLYTVVAGINADSPGYKTIRIQPEPGGGLTYAKASYDSIYGRIVSDWRLEGNRLALTVTIPANTRATVHVPAGNADSVTESGRPAAQAAGVKFLRMEGGAAVYEVLAGTYHFVAEH